jgi:hypothetical protein
MPLVAATSITAVPPGRSALAGSCAQCASTGRSSGPSTMTVRFRAPGTAVANAATVPSPAAVGHGAQDQFVVRTG